MSNVAGSIPLVLNVASPLVLRPASPTLSPSAPPSIGLPCSSTAPSASSRRRAAPRSARLRKLKRPSPPCVGEGDVAVERTDLPSEGVRSFHAATMLRTEVSGERGDVCGRRSDDAVGVAVVVKPVNVFEYEPVPVTDPGAELPPEPVRVYVSVVVRVWVNVLLVVGVNRESDVRGVPREGGESTEDIVAMGPEDDTEEPALLLFVGEEGREL